MTHETDDTGLFDERPNGHRNGFLDAAKQMSTMVSPDTLVKILNSIRFCKHGRLCKKCCWLWDGRTSNGYGRINVNFHGMMETYSHRIIWILNNARYIPRRYSIGQTCGNRRCCNPAHLRLVTQEELNAIRVQKTRDLYSKGDRVGNSKLSKKKVLKAREMKESGYTQNEIAKILGVTQPTISYLLNGHTWKEV